MIHIVFIYTQKIYTQFISATEKIFHSEYFYGIIILIVALRYNKATYAKGREEWEYLMELQN